MIVRFDNAAIRAQRSAHSIGVEGDPETLKGALSEADAIVSSVKKLQDEGMQVGPTPNAIDEQEAEAGNKVEGKAEEMESLKEEDVPELNTEALEEAKRKKEENAKAAGAS